MKSLIIALLATLAISTAMAAPDYQNTLALTIVNTTGSPGYFGTCVGPIHPDGRTICNTPQYIKTGESRIYVPPYPNSYPVFATDALHTYTCGNEKDLTQELFFPLASIKANILVLDSFIKNNDGNNVAMRCELIKPGDYTKLISQ